MRKPSLAALAPGLVCIACGGSASVSFPSSGSLDGSAPGDATTGPNPAPGDSGSPSLGPASPEGGASASDSGGTAPPTDAGGPTGAKDASNAAGPTIPKPTGTCPTIAAGDVTFAPAGISPRVVTLSMATTAPAAPGPLVLYWYATGSSVIEVPYALGTTLGTIESAGGIVAAPHADPTAGQFEWFAVNGSTKQDDFLLADEVVACLAQAGKIDVKHIHSMGMSAGALQTTYMSYVRSAYVASVTTYSGGVPAGVPAPTSEDPANLFSALIFEGGANDNAYGFNFEAASINYRSLLQSAGHFAAICNHGMGHMIPTAAAPSVWQFFTTNGFGVYPSPYVNGLPSTFPSYCTIGADAGP
jgi:hypothetical protein